MVNGISPAYDSKEDALLALRNAHVRGMEGFLQEEYAIGWGPIYCVMFEWPVWWSSRQITEFTALISSNVD